MSHHFHDYFPPSDIPCPFLRALVACRQLSKHVNPVSRIVDVLTKVARTGDGAPTLSRVALAGLAQIADGLSPLVVWSTYLDGLDMHGLRTGPLDKHGVGSRILDERCELDPAQLERMRTFARPKATPEGGTEPGLGTRELTAFMDANYARAAGQRRWVDRLLMDAEWPVLLQVMGRDGVDERYLSWADVHRLFTQRALPPRMAEALEERRYAEAG